MVVYLESIAPLGLGVFNSEVVGVVLHDGIVAHALSVHRLNVHHLVGILLFLDDVVGAKRLRAVGSCLPT